MNVLFLTSRTTSVLQHVTADLADGFRQLGHGTDIVMEREGEPLIQPGDVRAVLAQKKVDLVFQVDRHAWDWRHIVPAEIPFGCWVMDILPYLFEQENVRKLGKNDYTFAFWPGLRDRLHSCGYRQVELLTAAANDSIYNHNAMRKPEYECDIAFVTNIEDPGVTERRHMTRTMLAKWAIGTGRKVHLYGRGWEKYEEFAPYAKGPVAPGRDLASVYVSAQIHLHANEHTTWHQRVAECLACGGFILSAPNQTDRKAGYLVDHLEIGADIQVFSNRYDFERYVKLYCEDEVRRNILASQGQVRVLKDHVYRKRAAKILETVGLVVENKTMKGATA